MRLKKIFLLTFIFTTFGIYAGNEVTIKNSVSMKIRVIIMDKNEITYETKEIPSGGIATMKKCLPGRLLLVDWGEEEKDGRPKVIGLIMETEKGCNKKYIFTPNIELVEDKTINLRPFSLTR